MTLLLDTSQVLPDLRTRAVAEVIEFSGAPARVVHNCPDDEIQTRLEYFTMGGTHILTSQNSPQGLITTPALLKNADFDLFVISLKLAGTATHTHAPGRLLRPGDIFAMDLWRPYEYLAEAGGIAAFHIRLDRLGLPRDYVTRSGKVIHTSPLAAQLRKHLQILFRDADDVSQSPGASMVARATMDLVRAALVSAVDDEPFRHEGGQENLVCTVKCYIAQNLEDPDLGADQIARAMFVSVRQLYKFWETEPCPLSQWIIQRRLEAARDELMNPLGRNQTVASIAQRYGFANPTHFGRRFRQAYGMSPREWRQLRLADARTAPPRWICAHLADNPAPPALGLRLLSVTVSCSSSPGATRARTLGQAAGKGAWWRLAVVVV